MIQNKAVLNFLMGHKYPKRVVSDETMMDYIEHEFPSGAYRELPGADSYEKAQWLMGFCMENNIPINNEVVIKQDKRELRVLIADNSRSSEYIDYLNNYYKVTVVTHESIDFRKRGYVESIDLILCTGGEDVDPNYYGENIGKYTGINSKRDELENRIIKSFPSSFPKLGICRGAQFLTVMAGGKLIQDVKGHGQSHPILDNKTGRTFEITSTHHQMMYPFNMDEKKYDLIAFSKYFQSNSYLNGNNEQIDLPKNFLEPEIVYYPYINSLCIQGHPEYNHCPQNTKNWCFQLMENFLFKSTSKSKVSIPQSIDYRSIGELQPEDFNYGKIRIEGEF